MRGMTISLTYTLTSKMVSKYNKANLQNRTYMISAILFSYQKSRVKIKQKKKSRKFAILMKVYHGAFLAIL